MPSGDCSPTECQHLNKYATGARYSAVDGQIWYRCPDCKAKWSEPWKNPRTEEPEPPMTPEEEEQAPPDEGWSCMHKNGCRRILEGVCLNGCRDAADELAQEANEPPPPQPERRPPYLVGYSVAGHLYEVALPGDAVVQAVDGALVIKHAVGFVAGIVHVVPLISEEST